MAQEGRNKDPDPKTLRCPAGVPQGKGGGGGVGECLNEASSMSCTIGETYYKGFLDNIICDNIRRGHVTS